MSDSSSDSDEPNFIPQGVLRKRKGWAGEEMEFSRGATAEGGQINEASLKETFQNREVGVGYQHSTVMRQKTGLGVGVGKVVDMTGGGGGGGGEGGKKRKVDEGGSGSGGNAAKPGDVKKRLLASEEMREFKKQLKKMIPPPHTRG